MMTHAEHEKRKRALKGNITRLVSKLEVPSTLENKLKIKTDIACAKLKLHDHVLNYYQLVEGAEVIS